MPSRHIKIRKIAGAVIVGAGLTLTATSAFAAGSPVQTWEQVAFLSAAETMGYAEALATGTPEAVAAFVAAYPTSRLVAELLGKVPADVAAAAIKSLSPSVLAQVDIAAISAVAPTVAAQVAAATSFTTGSIPGATQQTSSPGSTNSNRSDPPAGPGGY